MSDTHSHGGPSHDITTHAQRGPSQDITIPAGAGNPPLHFTPEEWDQYRKSDMAAARSVVLLMGGIFTIGLALYSTVAYICWFRVM